MILAHRIRLAPSNAQRTWLVRCAGAARFCFNFGLARWHEIYSSSGKPSWQAINAELNARKATEFPWMADIPWRVMNGALADLGQAFTNFFRRCKQGTRQKGYPRFKSKKHSTQSFCIEGRALVFNRKKVRIPKLGWIRLAEPLRFPGKVLSARFTERAGHWYVSLQVEIDETKWVYPHRCETQVAVGVDLGVVDLAVLSTGERIAASRTLRAHEGRLRQRNKELSRRKQGGKNWQKTKAKLAKLHEHVVNIRRDVAHKLTANLVQRFRWIGVEDLNVAGMQRTRLAKSIADAAMSEVLQQLHYKALLAGSTIVEADRFYPSSKTCSTCGVVYVTLTLNERCWTCTSCGTIHDRDVNAATNLKAIAEAHSVVACCHESADVGRKTGVKLLFGQELSNTVNLS